MSEKRRNCADKARGEMMLRKIHRNRRIDPAMAVIIQMLGLTSFLFRLLPPMPEIVFVPRLCPPVPEPPPEPPAVPERVVRRVYKTSPSWPMLFRDLKRGVAHDQALEHIRARLPSSVGPWLDHIDSEKEYGLLQPYVVSGATDATVAAGVLAAAKDWQDAKNARAKKLAADRDGVKGAGSAAAPGTGDDDDDDDDTTKPKVPK